MKKWYVIRTKANQEKRAKKNLDTQGFMTFCPFFSYGHVLSPIRKFNSLFPSYMFVKLDIEKDNWSKINNTFGVIEILKVSSQIPCPISTDFITRLKKLCTKESLIRNSYFDFNKGQKVRLIDGPFFNSIAEVIQMDSKERVSILLKIFSRKIKILVAKKNIIPAK